MIEPSVQRIYERLGESDRVLDVGGWAKPFVRADWVLDALPYRTRGSYGFVGGTASDARFSQCTWVERDICGREPWPFADGEFDFAICSQTLEDLRDPIWACAELSRVARAGYIEVPARAAELTYGVHGPWVGWAHHRWLVDVTPDRIEFVMKTHAVNGAERFHLPADYCADLPPEDWVQTLFWAGPLQADERLLIGAEAHDEYITGFVEDQLRRRPARPADAGRLRRLLRR